jgi:hypothetical protein
MIKKKGQIVPKYLCESVEKKAQHLVKFGADVEIIGKTIKMLSDGYAIHIPSTTHVLKKKNQKTVKGFNLIDLRIIGFGGNCTAFRGIY